MDRKYRSHQFHYFYRHLCRDNQYINKFFEKSLEFSNRTDVGSYNKYIILIRFYTMEYLFRGVIVIKHTSLFNSASAINGNLLVKLMY